MGTAGGKVYRPLKPGLQGQESQGGPRRRWSILENKNKSELVLDNLHNMGETGNRQLPC